MGYFTINTVSEIICLLVAIFCLFRDKNAYWRSFVVYMFLVCLTELGGLYLHKHNITNAIIYTGFLIIECSMVSSFFYYLFYKYHPKSKWIYIWLVIFIIAYITELANIPFNYFPNHTTTFMSVVFVIASLYYYLLITRDETFRNLGSYPQFWIVNGILFFYFGSTACNVFFEYLLQEIVTSMSMSIRYITFNILNILLYGCWSYAFICRYRQRNSFTS